MATDFESNLPFESDDVMAIFYRDAWRTLFRSRRSLLHEFYLHTAARHKVEIDLTSTPGELRKVLFNRPGISISADAPIFDQLEQRYVCCQRAGAIWQVFWMTLLPVAVLLGFAIPRMMNAWPEDWLSIASTILWTLGLLPVVLFVTFVCQAKLIERYGTFVNWLAPFPDHPWRELERAND